MEVALGKTMARNVGGGIYSKATAHLGIDPLAEKELLWIAQHATTARLPPHWVEKVINKGEENEEIIFLNEVTREQRRESPVLSRCRKLVQLFRASRQQSLPLDEVSVLELLDPIPDPAAVLATCEHLGIRIPTAPRSNENDTGAQGMGNWESHLVWIAKLAVLDELPDGWEEVATDDEGPNVDSDGAPNHMAQFVKKDGDEAPLIRGEHPKEDAYREIIARERARRPPKQVLYKDLYEYGAIRFRRDVRLSESVSRPATATSTGDVHATDGEGGYGHTRVVPALGMYIDLYDDTGTKYFYHVLSGAKTYDIDIVRRDPAATIIQRCYRGYRSRQAIDKEFQSARRIQSCWRTFKYRRALNIVSLSQHDAAVIIQRCYRTHAMSVIASRECFRRLAELKGTRRPGRIDYSRVGGLLATKLSFRRVLRHVITLQRHFRDIQRQRRRSAKGIGTDAAADADGDIVEESMMVENLKRENEMMSQQAMQKEEEERAAVVIQSSFRGMQERRRLKAMRENEVAEEERREREIDMSADTDADASNAADEEPGEVIADAEESAGSGRTTPLPERKIVTEMNEKAAMSRPKSRGKTPKKAAVGDGDALSVAQVDDVPTPSKTESGAEVLVLGDGGDDGDVGNLLVDGGTSRSGLTGDSKEGGSGDGEGGSSATVTKARTNGTERGESTRKQAKAVKAVREKNTKKRVAPVKKKPSGAPVGTIDNTVSTRTKLKGATPTTPRSKPKRVSKSLEGTSESQNRSSASEARMFGRSTIVATARVKQIKIGSMLVSPIGAVKRTKTPDKNLSNQKSRPKTPSKTRPSTAKKKLDIDGNGDLNKAAAPAENADDKDGAAPRPDSVSYPSPSSSRSSSRENRATKKVPKKASTHTGTLSANNGSSADNDLDDVDLFAKIKEQRQRTEHLLQSVNHTHNLKNKKTPRRI